MGIQKITFEGGNVSAKKDADLQYFLFSNRTGILKGIKNGVSYTLSNNMITFQDGYVAVFGRLIYVESNTAISITPDSTKNGYVVLGINTTSNEVSLYLKEQASGFPSLVTTQLVNNDGLYEYALASYSKTSTSVTLTPNFQRPTLLNYTDLISGLEQSMRSDSEPKVQTPTTISPGVYRISGTSSTELSRSIILVSLGFNFVVTIPGISLFYKIGSSNSVAYNYYGGTFSIFLHYENGNLTMTCGSTSHMISKVIIYKF